MRRHRKFGVEFKRKVVEEVRGGVLTMAQAIRQYELSSNLIYRWMDHYEHGKLDNTPTEQGTLENKIADLERKVGQQAMEIELLKNPGPVSREAQREIIRSHTEGSVKRRCEVMKIPRSAYYYKPQKRDREALVGEIEAIVVEFSGYGYRRVTKELKRRGTHVLWV